MANDKCQCENATWNENTLTCVACGKRISDDRMLLHYGEASGMSRDEITLRIARGK